MDPSAASFKQRRYRERCKLAYDFRRNDRAFSSSQGAGTSGQTQSKREYMQLRRRRKHAVRLQEALSVQSLVGTPEPEAPAPAVPLRELLEPLERAAGERRAEVMARASLTENDQLT